MSRHDFNKIGTRGSMKTCKLYGDDVWGTRRELCDNCRARLAYHKKKEANAKLTK